MLTLTWRAHQRVESPEHGLNRSWACQRRGGQHATAACLPTTGMEPPVCTPNLLHRPDRSAPEGPERSGGPARVLCARVALRAGLCCVKACVRAVPCLCWAG